MTYLVKNYNRINLAFKKGSGSFLYTNNGTKYLDFVQGIAVNSLGHSNKILNRAIFNQSKKLWHVSNAFTIPEGELLAKKLQKYTFADSVLFQNSGAEATEAAIKVARRYFYSLGKKHKYKILCIKNSFHGRTVAAMNASGSKKMMEGFGPKIPGFDHFNYGDHFNLKRMINKNTAAVMVEPILGEGGIKVIPEWCLKSLRQLCDKKKILLILDEVQCGIGRTGKFFAFEYAKVKPDIVPIAKGLGGGFPIGAVLMTNKISKSMPPGSHGSTFGGNPLAMSVGNAVFDQIKKRSFLKNINKVSGYFMLNLTKLKNKFPKIIKEVRGKGLLIGLQLNVNNNDFIKRLRKKKLLTIKAGENVVRILPPLNVKKNEINSALQIIEKVCKSYK
ncbi:MAG: aspartate aminotransferase family protein [Rickettsiales bacterium TMED289]|nr:MAG: aspartate aminotransferase family protein [Rickettsiales bacterium TMED289]|tara:strand:+ start:1300 stop:2466 length:1167 start_codon:yes stop_codon:yes gene_type:complete